MNKFNKILLAILGAIDVVMYMVTPIFLAVLWYSVVEVIDWKIYFFFTLGLFATLFRAIKIGFMKNND